MLTSSKIATALATLGDDTRVTRGTPAGAPWIAAQEKAARTRFDPSYVAFLKEFGALRLETDELDDWHADLIFPGHAPHAPELDLGAAREWLDDTFERWGSAPEPGVPVMMYGDGSGWPDAVVTADGALFGFHRHSLSPKGGDFEAEVLARIEAIRAGLAGGEVTVQVRGSLLGACVASAPASWNAREVGGRALFRRPSDGVEIEARLGDGRELSNSDGQKAVFVAWHEDASHDLEALNAWNQRASFVRASRAGGRTRYRGLLPVSGLDARLLLERVAHDAGLPLDVAPRPVPTLEVLTAAIAEPPLERSFFRKRWSASELRTEGDGVVLAVGVADWLGARRKGAGPPAMATVRARPDGLVEVVHRSKVSTSRADALAGLEQLNLNVLGENNADLEPCVRGVLEPGEVAALGIVTTVGALPTPAFTTQVAHLSQAIAKATFLAKPDPLDVLRAEAAEQIGRPVGPHLEAMLEYLHLRSLGLLRGGAGRRFASPWGTLLELGTCTSKGVSFARHTDSIPVTVTLAIDHGATSDDCPVVGFEETWSRDPEVTWPGRLLAKDLAAFASILQLRTTGFDFDGDDDFVWRSFRAQLADSRFGSPRPEEELGARVGIAPASSVAKVLADATSVLPGLPRSGEVRG